MQRLKKQRQRQVTANKQKALAAADPNKKEIPLADIIVDEETLKEETMNSRSVKRFMNEMNEGIAFTCALRKCVELILKEIDPSFTNVLEKYKAVQNENDNSVDKLAIMEQMAKLCADTSIGGGMSSAVGLNSGVGANNTAQSKHNTNESSTPTTTPTTTASVAANSITANNGAGGVSSANAMKRQSSTSSATPIINAGQNHQPQQQQQQQQQQQHRRGSGNQLKRQEGDMSTSKDSVNNSTPYNTAMVRPVNPFAETVEEGNPNGSTLRKHRKVHPFPIPTDAEESFTDSAGRKLTKKAAAFYTSDRNRFRTLDVGNYVAARVASHELWILARIVQTWKAPETAELQSIDYYNMTEAKRELMLGDQKEALIRDVEGEYNDIKSVQRQFILPLPKSYAEASEWCHKCIRKACRVYAMYPSTTSLYCATVIDYTTYCRGEDDIVVVEFDGDEDDVTGCIPQRHIPARFVTLIPREFESSAPVKRKLALRKVSGKGSANASQPSKGGPAGSSAKIIGRTSTAMGNTTGPSAEALDITTTVAPKSKKKTTSTAAGVGAGNHTTDMSISGNSNKTPMMAPPAQAAPPPKEDQLDEDNFANDLFNVFGDDSNLEDFSDIFPDGIGDIDDLENSMRGGDLGTTNDKNISTNNSNKLQSGDDESSSAGHLTGPATATAPRVRTAANDKRRVVPSYLLNAGTSSGSNNATQVLPSTSNHVVGGAGPAHMNMRKQQPQVSNSGNVFHSSSVQGGGMRGSMMNPPGGGGIAGQIHRQGRIPSVPPPGKKAATPTKRRRSSAGGRGGGKKGDTPVTKRPREKITL